MPLKLALVHDVLCGVGGSERVFQYLCEEFPEADLFTLAYNRKVTLPYFTCRRINTTYLNRFVRNRSAFRWSFPVATHAMEGLNLKSYDVVLTSSATVAKYVKVPNGKHLCYCYIPTRALWHSDEYFGKSTSRQMMRLFSTYLRKRDFRVAQKVDKFIAISKVSQGYIREYYHRDAEIVYCPIDLRMFRPGRTKGHHFLIVSRLEYWKRLDYAIHAFNALGLPLRIIGTGPEEFRLKAMSKKNITFLGAVDDEALAREYAEARAVIFTPFLEYGLIPLEANACGTPVICYGKGGVTETMIAHGSDDAALQTPTAVFFYEQSPESLIAAVQSFQKLQFDGNALSQHAKHWDVPQFKRSMREFVEHDWK